MKHNPALDGLRGVAVSFVVIEHAGYRIGSHQTVQVFFVLSGYLITTILWKELDTTGTISLPRFYMRRALRLLPALWTMVAFAVITSALTNAEPFKITAVGAAFALSFTTNIGWARDWTNSHFLLQTWTLSIEEQFYLVCPFLLLFINKPRWRRYRPQILVALTLVLLVGFMVLGTLKRDAAPRVLPPTDSLGLCLGAAIAAITKARGHRVTSEWAASLLMMAAVAMYVTVAYFQPYQDSPGTARWGVILTAAASGILVWVCLTPSVVSRFFALAPLVWVGVRSYGVYIYNYPIAALVGLVGLPHPAILAVEAVASVAAAAVSYRWIELPALRAKDRLGALVARKEPVNAQV